MIRACVGASSTRRHGGFDEADTQRWPSGGHDLVSARLGDAAVSAVAVSSCQLQAQGNSGIVAIPRSGILPACMAGRAPPTAAD